MPNETNAREASRFRSSYGRDVDGTEYRKSKHLFLGIEEADGAEGGGARGTSQGKNEKGLSSAR